jgi:hypothetical protein
MQLTRVPHLPPEPDSQPQYLQDAESPEPEEPDIHCIPDDNITQHHPLHAGHTYGETRCTFPKQLSADWNSWHPFKITRDFALDSWIIDSGHTKTAIDDYLQGGLDNDLCTSFHSADDVWTVLKNLEFGFRSQSWTWFTVEPESCTL